MTPATAGQRPAAGAEQQQTKPTWESRAYATYRPTYPPALYDAIMAKHMGGRALAVDIGCGSGQVTADLAPRFDKVVGVDASASQLAHARSAPNVAYQQGTAEATGLADGCADLITVAAALHW